MLQQVHLRSRRASAWHKGGTAPLSPQSCETSAACRTGNDDSPTPGTNKVGLPLPPACTGACAHACPHVYQHALMTHEPHTAYLPDLLESRSQEIQTHMPTCFTCAHDAMMLMSRDSQSWQWHGYGTIVQHMRNMRHMRHMQTVFGLMFEDNSQTRALEMGRAKPS